MKLMERLTTLGMVADNSFHFPLRQSHIAEITGLTPVHVSRVINLLRREGLIDLRNRTIIVRDPAALQRVCNRKGANIATRAQQSA
jgi:CRP-like cAMP-binding protein